MLMLKVEPDGRNHRKSIGPAAALKPKTLKPSLVDCKMLLPQNRKALGVPNVKHTKNPLLSAS